MQAIVIHNPGRDYQLKLQPRDAPSPTGDELLVNIEATAVNRADLLQARGLYAPPPGTSPLLGLECAGRVAGTDKKVMCLLPGGGYATQAAVHKNSTLPIPKSYSMLEAGAFMETALTAYLNIFVLGGLKRGQRVLVHGGSSGVGTMAIQLCRTMGIETIVTAGTDEKCARCLELGAGQAIHYRSLSFQDVLGENSVDGVLDCVGAPYLDGNIRVLKPDGKLLLIGLMGGAKTEVNLASILAKRISLIGSTLRPLSLERKSELIQSFQTHFGNAVDTGAIRPVIHKVFPLAEAGLAHQLVHTSQHIGKVVLEVSHH